MEKVVVNIVCFRENDPVKGQKMLNEGMFNDYIENIENGRGELYADYIS